MAMLDQFLRVPCYFEIFHDRFGSGLRDYLATLTLLSISAMDLKFKLVVSYKIPSPDLNLTPLAAFLRFLPSAASLAALGKNVKKQQEVSDLNQD